MTSQAARISPVQKCRKTGTRATCWVIPSIIWKKLADHPEKSLRARLGLETRAWASSLPRASTGSSIKAQDLFCNKTSLAYRAGYQPSEKMSSVDRRAETALLSADIAMGR